MKTEVLGDGEPEYAVVACVHGDEPEGWEAIQRFKDSDYELEKPLKIVLANEEAKNQGQRFLEKNLNRVFPGDENGSHEEQLAARIFDELEGLKILDLHTTESEDSPFAIISRHTRTQKQLAKSTGIDVVIDMTYVEGGLDDHLEAVVVESSRGENAVEELYKTMVNFLAAEGVIEEEFERSEPDFFEVYDHEEGGGYEFTAENFRPVETGQVFAEGRDDTKIADEEFHPVLMSTDGYDDMIGFKAKKREF